MMSSSSRSAQAEASALVSAAKDAAMERCQGYLTPIKSLFGAHPIPDLADSIEFHLNVLAFSLDATFGLELEEPSQTVPVMEHVHDAIVQSGVIDRYIDYLVYLVSCEWAALSGQAGSTGGYILNRLLNSTDRSLNFSLALARRGKFFRDFYGPFLSRVYPRHGTESAARTLAHQAVNICINLLLRNDSDIYASLSQYRLHVCTKPYLKSSNATLSTSALILIAFAVDESQAEIFLGARENISYLINTLKQGLTAPDRRSDGFEVLESAKCINRLALNDVNKDLLVELELLPVVRKMLVSSNSSDVMQGMEILFTLSFSPKNAAKISSEFRDILNKLQADEKWHDTKVLQSLLFHLNEEKKQNEAIGRTPSGKEGRQDTVTRGQVMISYNHASKQIVKKLYKRLIDSGLDVWVDFKDLTEGSTLDAMSAAVENSSVVLLCATRLYKESNNCRLEAEYAWKCGKQLIPLLMEPKYKATGWLGMLMGTQLYYDFTETKYPFEQKFAELLPALLARLGSRDAPVPPAAQPPPSSSSSSSAQGALPPIVAVTGGQPPLRDWDEARVSAWCRERRLPPQVAAKRLTGRELHFLAGAMHRSPEYFGRLMERHFDELGGGLCDLASLANALEDLWQGAGGRAA